MERYIERVKKSIADKEPPLKVAETRLKKRTQAGSGNFPPKRIPNDPPPPRNPNSTPDFKESYLFLVDPPLKILH